MPPESGSLVRNPPDYGALPVESSWIGLTPLEAIKVLLQHRRLLILLPLTLFALVVGTGLIGKRSYSSTLVFVPQLPTGGMGGAEGIAAELGINLPGVDLTQTPDFYVALVASPSLMRDVVMTKYRVINDDGAAVSEDLIAVYKEEGATRAIARDKAVDDLTSDLTVGANLKTGIVTVSVRSNDAGLSMQIGERILQLINDFNSRTRSSRAGQERQFAAGRLADARRELRSAEDSLQQYQERNRMFQTSPYLVLGMERMQREVVRRDALVSLLSQKYDQARVEEARNTASITVMETPSLAARPDRRGLVVKGLISLVAGGLLAIVIIWVRQFIFKFGQADPETWGDVVIAWNASTAVVRSGASRVRRVLPGRVQHDQKS